MAKGFRDLQVWHLSVSLSLAIYEMTTTFPKHELYGLTSQMRRASVSIASNIAEGSARKTRRDYRQFVTIALGSNYELQTQLLLSRHLHYATPDQLDPIEALCHRIARMLTRLEDYLRKPPPATTVNDPTPNN
ncbi:four helix bundle protein [Bryocella elongata]|uniref:Four helix bundle protein n=1 Tax=Bryocella elongata TaxID=863522 RepID=A0A1H5S7K7_9BACT|nr:four helix bundle protein [Bryocella elongata]SEF46400.1 four helix bundle protein [Bryocella elongata]